MSVFLLVCTVANHSKRRDRDKDLVFCAKDYNQVNYGLRPLRLHFKQTFRKFISVSFSSFSLSYRCSEHCFLRSGLPWRQRLTLLPCSRGFLCSSRRRFLQPWKFKQLMPINKTGSKQQYENHLRSVNVLPRLQSWDPTCSWVLMHLMLEFARASPLIQNDVELWNRIVRGVLLGMLCSFR